MKTNVAETSRNCYFNHVKGFKENGENKIIFEALRLIQPATCRQLAIATGIENSATARTLNNLWFKLTPPPIHVSHTGTCPISGKTVKFYEVSDRQLSMDLN